MTVEGQATRSVFLEAAEIVAADPAKWPDMRRLFADSTTVVRLLATNGLGALLVKQSPEMQAPQPLRFIALALAFVAVEQSEVLSERPLEAAKIFRQLQPEAATFLAFWVSPGTDLNLAARLAQMEPPTGPLSAMVVDVCDAIVARCAAERAHQRQSKAISGRLVRWWRGRSPVTEARQAQRIEWNGSEIDALCVDTLSFRAIHLAALDRHAEAEASLAEALKLAEAIAGTNSSGDGALGVAHVHAAWGSLAATAADHAAAIGRFGQAIAQLDTDPSRSGSAERQAFLARVLRMRARSFSELKEYAAATSDYDTAASLAASDVTGDELDAIAASSGRGIALARMDRFADAADELARTIAACEEVRAKHPSDEATRYLQRALANRGHALVRLERFEEAIRDLDEAERVSPSTLSGSLAIAIRQNRANALLGLGRSVAAMQELEGAIDDGEALAAEGDDDARETLARMRCDRGTTHYRLGRLPEAVADFEAALQIYATLNAEHAERARHTTAAPRDPVVDFEGYVEPPPYAERIAATLLPVTAVLIEAEQLDAALDAATRAVEVYQALVDVEGRLDLERYLASAHCNVSIVQAERGDTPRAVEHARRALATFRRLTRKSGTHAIGQEFANALSQAADLALATGDWTGAVRMYEEAADHLHQMIEHAETELERQRRRASHAGTLNGLLVALARLSEAGEPNPTAATPADAARGVTWAERAAYWAEWGRARNLADLLAAESRPPVGIPPAEFDTFEQQRAALRDVDQRLAILEDAGARATALDYRDEGIERDRERLGTQRAQLLASLAAALERFQRIDPSWAPAAPLLTIAEIKAAAVDIGMDFLTLRTTKWGTCAIHVAPTGLVRTRLIPALDGTVLGTLVGTWLTDYATLERTPSWHRQFETRAAAWRATQERVLDEVGATLWRPLCAWLDDPSAAPASAASPRALVLMPAAGLVNLPLHAARWHDGHQTVYVGERYEMTYAPSVAVMRRCVERRSAQTGATSLLAVNNPTGHDARSSLMWSELEADAACEVWTDHVRLSSADHDRFEAATRERLMRELPRHSIALLATHGIYDAAHPWTKSGLFTADGETGGGPQLTMADFYDMDLNKSQLMLLTACESGLTDPLDRAGEQLGLPSAMLASGASAVIASLWTVDDMSTALLAGRFFDEAAKHPARSIASALAASQRWLRTLRADEADALLASIQRQLPVAARARSRLLTRESVQAARSALASRGPLPFSHPSYWAAFCCFGASQPLAGTRPR
jgi:CHAT domain-containing protein/tetratricopeptide (TPR) repeat protein